MVALSVIITIIACIVADLWLRRYYEQQRQRKLRSERQKALDIGLQLNFANETPTLSRVEVDKPRAKILAVDDETVILDILREILVLEGYAVDTVESGPEALTLLKSHTYDFIFTDLKMPEMDGVELTKAVKHIRPDVDVIVITGFATIESVVETMKHGAVDYLQKPFTGDELIEFVNKAFHRREDRLLRRIKPKMHLVTPREEASASMDEFNVPVGMFVSPGHTWMSIQANGTVHVGLDDFARKILGRIDSIDVPSIGQTLKRGEGLFRIVQGTHAVDIPSPCSGRVLELNSALEEFRQATMNKPYEQGWICRVESTDLSHDLQSLRIGSDASAWYQTEIDRYIEMIQAKNTYENENDKAENLDERAWGGFVRNFLLST